MLKVDETRTLKRSELKWQEVVAQNKPVALLITYVCFN